MVYWHVEKKAACIYSQLKSVSSSGVAAMIEGVLRHCTDMSVEKNFVDSHGQSEVAFAFTRLLGFHLMPRLKGLHAQKLYRPIPGPKEAYPHLQPVLTRPVNWVLIRQQYDEMVKFATALRLGTAEPEATLRRFTRASVQHPPPTRRSPNSARRSRRSSFAATCAMRRSAARSMRACRSSRTGTAPTASSITARVARSRPIASMIRRCPSCA
jgi:TnpA family transposase